MKRALIAAAGTGGHIFPALAVAEALREQGWQVDWLGTEEGRLDARVVPAAGFPLHTIAMTGIRGHGVKRLIKAPLLLWSAIKQCRQLLRQLQPDVVVTFGGYVCAPMGLAAKQQGLPLIVHEQNAVAGMTTRLLAPFAQKVLLGLPLVKRPIKKAQLVGNPLRQTVLDMAVGEPDSEREAPSAPLRLLVVGGSLGAKVLNEVVPEALSKIEQPLVMHHQSGAGNQADVEARYRNLKQHKVTVSEFIDNMGQAYQQADLVICRAGALTVSELAVLGKAAIFVPLPHAVDDHQTANARTIEAAGGAMIMPQTTLSPTTLAKQLQSLLQAPQQLWKMARFARQTGRPNATRDVVQICQELAASAADK